MAHLIDILLGSALGAIATLSLARFVNGKLLPFLPPKAKAIASVGADLVKAGEIKVDGELTEDEARALVSALVRRVK